MHRKSICRIITVLALSVFILSALPLHAFADENSVSIAGAVYEFGEKDHYEFDETKGAVGTSVDNTYGSFSVSGDLTPDTSADGIPSFLVNSGQISLTYSYTDIFLNREEEEWHLVDDKTKDVNDTKLDSNIMCGAVILQTSKDGKKWVDNLI